MGLHFRDVKTVFFTNVKAKYRKIVRGLKCLNRCCFWPPLNKYSQQINTLEYKSNSKIFVLLT